MISFFVYSSSEAAQSRRSVVNSRQTWGLAEDACYKNPCTFRIILSEKRIRFSDIYQRVNQSSSFWVSQPFLIQEWQVASEVGRPRFRRR